MSTYWLIRSAEEIDTRFEFLKAHLIESGVWPISLTVKKYIQARSIPQNNTLHGWFREIAKYLTDNNRPTNARKVKLLMKHKYLGYEDIQVGDMTIEHQLRHTSKLDTAEMHHFMSQVEEWATNIGAPLTIPVASEYYELREAQNQ
jgi:hypothetical protein